MRSTHEWVAPLVAWATNHSRQLRRSGCLLPALPGLPFVKIANRRRPLAAACAGIETFPARSSKRVRLSDQKGRLEKNARCGSEPKVGRASTLGRDARTSKSAHLAYLYPTSSIASMPNHGNTFFYAIDASGYRAANRERRKGLRRARFMPCLTVGGAADRHKQRSLASQGQNARIAARWTPALARAGRRISEAQWHAGWHGQLACPCAAGAKRSLLSRQQLFDAFHQPVHGERLADIVVDAQHLGVRLVTAPLVGRDHDHAHRDGPCAA